MTTQLHFEDVGGYVYLSDMQPVPDSYQNLRSGKQEGEISTILGKVTGAKCTIGVGKPICAYLDNNYEIKGSDLPQNAKGLSGNFKKYKYFVVRFACAFVTIRNCQIDEARFDVQLMCDNIDEPIALDLLPSRVITPSSQKKKVTTKIGVNLKFLEYGTAGEHISEFEHEKYEPEIFSYGVQTSKFRWKLKRTEKNPIEGDRFLFAIIGKPQNTLVHAKFKVTAEIQTTAFRKLILDTRNDEVANISYALL